MASDNTKSSNPPPYNPYAPEHFPNNGSEMGHKDGTVNVTVISPMDVGMPGDQQNGSGPPAYIQDFEETNHFSDASIRRGFLKKVYFTLMIQLLTTVGIICAFLYWEDLKKWTFHSSWFTYATMGSTVFLMLTLACCVDVRRKVPLNFILLGLFTIVEGLMLGSVCVFFTVEAVLWAVGATALVTFSLTLFAMQTKWDFTTCAGSIWVLVWSLISFGLLCAIMRSNYVQIVYACLGTMAFSLYLVVDTQLMLGGKHRYALDPEEYVFAALNLYLDIVNLFLLLLQLISLCSE